jgi:hypothetical protein
MTKAILALVAGYALAFGLLASLWSAVQASL